MNINKVFALFTILCISLSCKDKVDTNNVFKFRDYISYTTSGRISVANPIKISLADDVEQWEMGQDLDTDLIKIEPFVEGKLQAVNKTTLLFTPDENLDSATEYTVTIDIGSIYKNIPKDFKSYTFQFITITPSFNISTSDIQSYSKEWQYVSAYLRSADVINLNDAKKLVSASLNDNDLKLVWNETNENSKYFEFKIDSVQRFVEDSKIDIKWNGNAIEAENKGENSILIAGKNNFTIVKTEIFQSPEQYLSINFSDPLKKQQNFEGLVSMQNTKNLKYVVDGNVLKVYPGSKLVGDIQVDVFTGIKNTDDYKLKSAFTEHLTFEDIKPQVRLINNGVFLPTSNSLNFNFEAVNLSAVDVRVIKIFQDNVLQFLQNNAINSNDNYTIRNVGRRIAKKTITLIENEFQNTGKWKAYSVDLSNFIKADPGAIYRVEVSFNRDYSLYDCKSKTSTPTNNDDDYYSSETLSNVEQDILEEKYWDNIVYNYKNNNYRWRDKDNPCTDSYYNYRNRSISQNIIGSNLGIIAKQGTANSYIIAVTNLLTTSPETGATVTLYNYQQQELSKGLTNVDGVVEFNLDKHAAFAVVSKGQNTSYIRLVDGSSLSLSKFDVSGKRLQRGLKGYIYGERGVWRPGDSLYLTFVLNDKANELPNRHPVKLEVTDPVGKLVHRTVSIDNVNHFYDFVVPTSSDYKTGNYNAKVSVGGATLSKNLKIETVKPNRLKIKIDFEDDILKNKTPLKGNLEVVWLHGAPAKNIKAEITAKVTPNNKEFAGFKGYVFSDPTRKFSSEDVNVFTGKLDANGKAKINKTLNIGKNAPGMLNAQFLVRAFESGGDFSLDAFTMPYAPYDAFVGLRSPEGNRYGSFFTDQNHKFDIVTVNSEGKPIPKKGLEVKVYKVEWRWWWNSSYDDLASYVSSNYHRPIQQFDVDTDANGKANISINIPDSERGRFLIRVYDSESGHATGRIAYFYKDWWRSSPSADKEAAKMLVFSADKTSYNVGEIAKLTFPSGNEGRALISIENGSEVLDYQWVATEKGETTVDIPITEAMAPNVFINISLLQPHDVTSNDLPIRLYGVIPIMVENPDTRLTPKIEMPETVRPNADYEIKVSEKNKKAMTYTIAVVEEGLLDLTRFKTPNVWDDFYARQALGVKTWDIYDDIIGAYSGSVEQVFAIGGDDSAAKAKNKKANRFKPVVTYLGPFTLDAGEITTHQLKMPNYVGAVRAMVVAGNNESEAYGSEEQSVKVKQPLMALATLPRKLSPGEKVTLPVTIFAMENKMKNVNVEVKASNGITINGSSSKSLQFNKPDEKMLYFDLDVSKAKGINTVEVIAKGHGETSTYKVEIDVENPNPFTTKIIDKELSPNADENVPISTFGVAGTNSAIVEFSTLPPMDFSKRLNYLIQYPHGCVEQTTSSVFPQLFLTDIFDLTSEKKTKVQSNIENGIKRLAHFQRPNGGMSYWIGEKTANDWGTSYAGHFMIEAEQKGFVLPLTFKSNWLRYQKRAAQQWRPSYRNYNSDLAQAYRLYTLALAGQADLGSMNRLREFEELSNEAKWRLAAAYALAGQTEASNAIAKLANIDFQIPKQNYYTYGSIDRNRAMALETMIITKNPKATDLGKSIGKRLSSNTWMSTQTTAYNLLAIAKMISNNGGKAINLSYSINGQSETINSKNGIAQRTLSINDGQNVLALNNSGGNLVYVRILNSGKLKLGQEVTEQRGFSISTNFKDTQGNILDISKLQQGQDIVATVSISNLTNDAIKDVALTQIFPSGWDIVNTRFTEFGDTTTSQARYTDIRDDRINFYFDMNKKGKYGTKTFTVLLNASYLGTYYLPGAQAEAMYDNDYLVRNKGRWVTVEK